MRYRADFRDSGNGFGGVDATTRRNGIVGYSVEQLRERFVAKYALMLDGQTGKPIGRGGALALWEEQQKR